MGKRGWRGEDGEVKDLHWIELLLPVHVWMGLGLGFQRLRDSTAHGSPSSQQVLQTHRCKRLAAPAVACQMPEGPEDRCPINVGVVLMELHDLAHNLGRTILHPHAHCVLIVADSVDDLAATYVYVSA